VLNKAFLSTDHHYLNMTALWVVARIALKMEAASISGTSINLYQTTRRNNPGDSHLYTRCRENLKSHHYLCCRDWDGKNMSICIPEVNNAGMWGVK
jgi:hypothetical protein